GGRPVHGCLADNCCGWNIGSCRSCRVEPGLSGDFSTTIKIEFNKNNSLKRWFRNASYGVRMSPRQSGRHTRRQVSAVNETKVLEVLSQIVADLSRDL